jgi:hypothetical protein
MRPSLLELPRFRCTLRLLALALLLCGAACQTALAAGGGQLVLSVAGTDGKPLTCRMHLSTAAGRPRKPDAKTPYYHDHFVVPGSITLRLPPGQYVFELDRGPEYVTREGHFTINNFADDTKQVELKRCVDMAEEGWYSGDLFVRRPARDIELLMAAEDLHLAELVTWWNDQSDWGTQPPPKDRLLRFADNRCCYVMAGGQARSGTTLLAFNLQKPWRLAGEFPCWPKLLKELREIEPLWVDLSAPFWWDLPLLVAHGQADSIQVAHSHLHRTGIVGNEADGRPRDRQRYPDPPGNAQWSQFIYFQLLESGLRIPPTAGSGSGMAPNPVGYNRAYVHCGREFSYENWFKNLKAGRVCVTNGPLLRPTVSGELPGHVFQAPQGSHLEFEIGLTLSTREPISYLELIKDGQVEQSVRFDDYARTGKLPKLQFDRSGWFLVRAVTDLPKTYRFAMTGPYFVEVGYEPRISKRAVQFFVDWVYERARQIKLDDSAAQRELVEYHRQARDFWQLQLSRANAP